VGDIITCYNCKDTFEVVSLLHWLSPLFVTFDIGTYLF